ncbi:MAG TPA: GNAT family N-acetyltransferase [Thermodesulfovibrionales bacterium]|nr:GNAT family N-acetyltransferase [Thermodesulfovibrionales bacterium]
MNEGRYQNPAGSSISIRQATEGDSDFIKDRLRQHNFDVSDFNYQDFVVAQEDGEPIGFGRLRKTGPMHEIGNVTVIEERRGQGIGSLIIRHLIDTSSTRMVVVYVTRDLIPYFEKLGFSVMKEGSKELYDALDEAFRISGKTDTAIMVYEKPAVAQG